MKLSWHKSGHSAMSDRFGGKADMTHGRSAMKKWSPSPPLGLAKCA
jgi:hypothetical protein